MNYGFWLNWYFSLVFIWFLICLYFIYSFTSFLSLFIHCLNVPLVDLSKFMYLFYFRHLWTNHIMVYSIWVLLWIFPFFTWSLRTQILSVLLQLGCRPFVHFWRPKIFLDRVIDIWTRKGLLDHRALPSLLVLLYIWICGVAILICIRITIISHAQDLLIRNNVVMSVFYVGSYSCLVATYWHCDVLNTFVLIFLAFYVGFSTIVTWIYCLRVWAFLRK